MNMKIERTAKEKRESLRLTILERTTDLFTAAMSLVAALAWNDAIQSLFRLIFGEAASLVAKFIYAIAITVLVVFVVMRLTKLTRAMRDRLDPCEDES